MRLRVLKLRPLKQSDAEQMLEWMNDKSVVEKLQGNFMEKTLEDCRKFIENSRNEHNIHLAIADDKDNYMGTVSLKHITPFSAEFAIAIRKEAMGKGFSKWAMKEILNKALLDYKVEYVYWCVAEDNERAIKFYDKNGYKRVEPADIEITGEYTRQQIDAYIWYRFDLSMYDLSHKK